MTDELKGICNSANGRTMEISFDMSTGKIVLKTDETILVLDLTELRKLKKTIGICEQALIEWSCAQNREKNLDLF